MNQALLRPADLRLITIVAARRRGEPAPVIDEARIATMLGELTSVDGDRPASGFHTGAALADGVRLLLGGGLGRQAALLAVCCQLRLSGYQLTAPQGVMAGMIDGLSRGRISVADLARWLEDRALLLGGG